MAIFKKINVVPAFGFVVSVVASHTCAEEYVATVATGDVMKYLDRSPKNIIIPE